MRRGRVAWGAGLLAIALACAAAPAAAAAAWEPGPVRFGVATERNVAIEMSDGTTLRADVYYPVDLATSQRATGSFPVVMNQTPYGKQTLAFAGQGSALGDEASGLAKPLHSLVQRGYINVIADIRGTGNSGGEFGLLDPQQGRDGAELVTWASKLPNASGKVGLYGPSYMGIIQYLTVQNLGRGSPLRAMFPVVVPNDPYREFLTAGGALAGPGSVGLLGIFVALPVVMPIIDGSGDLEELLDLETSRLLSIFGNLIPLGLNVILGEEEAYEEEFWRARRPGNGLDDAVRNRVPVFSVGGWFDVFQRGTLRNYSGLQNLESGRAEFKPMRADQPVSSRYQALMGPWVHTLAGDGFKLEDLAQRWFDTWLKGKETGLKRVKRPIHAFDLGRERYVDSTRYPFHKAPARTYWFRGEQSGSAGSQNDGSLTTDRPTASEGSDTVLYTGLTSPCTLNPDQYGLGVLSLGLSTLGFTNPCFEDDRSIQVGPSALTYTTRPFTNPKTIGGPIDATVFATSTRPEVELHAFVEDVYPDGRSRPLTAGGLLGSFRELNRERTWFASNGRPVVPHHPFTVASSSPVPVGEVARYDIEVFPTLATLAAGHRLRVTISTALTGHTLPNAAQLPNLLGGVYEVQRNAARASFLNIPLAPAERFSRPCGICG